MTRTKIGIVGYGFVGKATCLFASDYVRVIVYDIDPDKCVPRGTTMSDIAQSDLVFVCVPTPMSSVTGKCHLGIVENVVQQIQSFNSQVPIVIRSTVPPGTCQRLGTHHMPEFLTEKSWEDDFRNTEKWIIGVDKSLPNYTSFRESISRVIGQASRDGLVKGYEIWWCDTKESEMTKYARNAFLATKVAFFNEMYQYCKVLGVRYEWVREMTTMDPRIGDGHSRVPGIDGKCGFSGTCLPKDLSALISEMKSNGVEPYLTQAVWDRNVNVDRPDKDWEQNSGRSIVKE